MIQTVVLALVQSATEFLPVSSSAHLILVPRIMNWPDQGVVMDIALHVGTLFAVMIYFKADVLMAVIGMKEILKKNFSAFPARLAVNLMVATIPALIFGFFLHEYLEEALRSPRVIACTAIVFGAVLYFADKNGKNEGVVETLSVKQALYIGMAQMIALIPGVSRSGITMTAARFLGIKREEAARFSMLLSIPLILAAAGWMLLKVFVLDGSEEAVVSSEIIVGMAVSFIGGALAISFLMNWLKRSSFAIFAVYRILLGIFLLCYF